MNMDCKSIKSHVSVFSSYGTIKPCCSIDIDNKFEDWESSSIFEIDNLNQSLEIPVRKNLYESLSNNWIDECRYCENLENQNFISTRQNYNDNFEGHGLEDLQIALDYYCNMTCRSCRPGVSSRWDSLTEEIEDLKQIDKHHYNDIGNHKAYVIRLKEVLRNTDFSNIKNVRLIGGEPFYSVNLKWFLKLLNEKTNLKNVTFSCNTNCSVLPDAEVLDLIKEFKSVKIDISIDAVGELAESIRYGVKWEKIQNTLNEWSKIATIMISPTVSILNINKLQSIIDLRYDYWFMPLHDPFYLRHTQIPLNIRKQWLTTDENVNKIITMPYKEIKKTHFRNAMSIMNRKMSSFSDANEEIWTLMN